ncbi:16S rRNA (adenine(1518)-N(6)/adenine(1519)-N(6))-dimethyltransferase RsmA [Cellulomonas fengjieae]|uniref:Ribosomal RNA small subunit methyltransferase A n=1 Tax=Cellulomonas fengjieae TaxID=2819978 RepID=A0ABS3SLE6_9CELL|nr:16S rRNA (adenine(1518)-N(6)/adenine(1519)-N(6))-dimethyltransferase RsmA [Cellulomonas fengjieae]MBO3086566.1 16S rRNA (adenine(1518)-N(6)/adenine(1519)-N(6))-dimethyltransferase RsmA [Cellulomonas fengjieae]MBO3100565.1 16S rRNA (adenine(1518)-N(6)/adenine(1519)-N(6))-dimethyltransferase RsmA [Cellulomonas fengjieae]QVI66579.1 16S rRNA (adenine(1518)-N(6)/adenine(1519)-N(6))-dimethyltransferase RsmA [Cellulomonas fengjieae]
MPTTTTLLGPAEIRRLAERAGVRPTKQLGQNFVLDGGTVRKIVRQADVGEGDRVVEVGPGLGSLTLGLLEAGADVVAVEIDPTLARLLPDTVVRHVPGLTVHAGADDEPVVLRDEAGRDRLTIVLADALDVHALPGPPPVALVANLPYNVSVPVLLTFLERFDSLERVLVMVQAEVADRLAAPPGSRTYGVPSAKAAWYASARRTATVGRSVFWPAPNVDSALVRFDRREPPVTDAPREAVFAVVDAAFAQRRKMLRSALSSLAGSADAAVAALEAAGVDPQARGERVDIAEFARIAEHLGPVRGRPGTVEP